MESRRPRLPNARFDASHTNGIGVYGSGYEYIYEPEYPSYRGMNLQVFYNKKHLATACEYSLGHCSILLITPKS